MLGAPSLDDDAALMIFPVFQIFLLMDSEGVSLRAHWCVCGSSHYPAVSIIRRSFVWSPPSSEDEFRADAGGGFTVAC